MERVLDVGAKWHLLHELYHCVLVPRFPDVLQVDPAWPCCCGCAFIALCVCVSLCVSMYACML